MFAAPHSGTTAAMVLIITARLMTGIPTGKMPTPYNEMT